MTSAGATALGYDGRGNLTSSGPNAYSYTSENRLVTAPGPFKLSYDPTGRLSRLSQNGVTLTQFEHLGTRLIIERDAAGAILRRYVHGPGADEPVVAYEGAGLVNKRWLHTDERGSVVAVSNSSGAGFAINAYDEYGIPASTNASIANGGRFAYTEQVWLPEIGLYYYKARMYSPTLGRFMQTDPIGYKDGINWYDYVDGDPINRTDPSGLCAGPLIIPCAAAAEKLVEGVVIVATVVIVWATSPTIPQGPQVSQAKEPSKEDKESAQKGKNAVTEGEQPPKGSIVIDKTGKGRSATGVVENAARAAGTKVIQTTKGTTTTVLPTGSKITSYPQATSNGQPSVVVTGTNGKTPIVKTREDKP